MCVAALVIPFSLIALSNEPVPSTILWAIDYLVYGFFSVFRVVLFCDYAERSNMFFLAGFGIMVGRFGDAAGTVLGQSLASSTVLLVIVATALFAATMFVFYQLFQLLFLDHPAPAKSEQDVFDTFASSYNLSPREREVLRLILNERTNAEIAAELFVSESTAKFHVRNLLKKTSCKNRVELMAQYAKERR